MNTEHKQALRHFHALCHELKMSADDKRAVVDGVGYQSSADIPAWKLRAICLQLRKQSNPRAVGMDALRKRVMASIGGWLRAVGYDDNAKMIKAVACRASGYDNFNKIPVGRLHNLYHNFRNKQQDKIAAERLMADIISHTTILSPGKQQLAN